MAVQHACAGRQKTEIIMSAKKGSLQGTMQKKDTSKMEKVRSIARDNAPAIARILRNWLKDEPGDAARPPAGTYRK